MTHYGILKLTIIEAKKLKGKKNAYVEIYLNKDYKQRTTTIKDSIYPKWNQTFTFNLEKNQDELHVDIYDDDVIRRDSIGSVKINLKKHVFGKDHYEQWLDIRNHFRSRGQIHLIVEHVF